MTISAISSSNASFISTFQKDRQTFGQLANAIQSGDLTSAQNAYNTLASSPLAQGNSPFAQALQQIGQDLQNNDIAGAQKALAVLQQQLQARGGHHHHHHGGGGVESASSTSNTNGSNASDPDGDGDNDGAGGTGQTGAVSATSDSDHRLDVTA